MEGEEVLLKYGYTVILKPGSELPPDNDFLIAFIEEFGDTVLLSKGYRFFRPIAVTSFRGTDLCGMHIFTINPV